MSHKKGKCLLLNSDYTPLTIVDWQKAIIWSLKHLDDPNYGIEIVDYYNDQLVVSGGNRSYRIPSVARSIKYFNLFSKSINFCRKNLFLRDNHTCQYCGQHFSMNQLTYDHVVPKSRYKPSDKHCTNWYNVVTSCIKCNRKKGNKTPEEAGMSLINNPCRPQFSIKYLHSYLDSFIINKELDHSQWRSFLHKHKSSYE
jgi:5-methylcytosine-specific restriction endonuclease McrA